MVDISSTSRSPSLLTKMFADLPVEESPIFQAARAIERAMWPFKPGHVYLEVQDGYNLNTDICVVVSVEKLKNFPIVVAVQRDMHANDIVIEIEKQVGKHFAGLDVPVHDQIILGEE